MHFLDQRVLNVGLERILYSCCRKERVIKILPIHVCGSKKSGKMVVISRLECEDLYRDHVLKDPVVFIFGLVLYRKWRQCVLPKVWLLSSYTASHLRRS